jgi:hypothetical protein
MAEILVTIAPTKIEIGMQDEKQSLLVEYHIKLGNIDRQFMQTQRMSLPLTDDIRQQILQFKEYVADAVKVRIQEEI